MIQTFFAFLQAVIPELTIVFNRVILDKEELSEEEERQLALNIIRKAKNQQARDEIIGR